MELKTPRLRESGEALVDLASYPFLMAPAYHWRGWTPDSRILLRRGVAERLLAAQESELAPRGWSWIAYDGWRPRSLQARIWSHVAAELSLANPGCAPSELQAKLAQWVANPFDPDAHPTHSTGGAIDLGIWDRALGRPVDLGAAFDEFSPQAALGYFEQPDHLGHQAAAPRAIMRRAIEAVGMVQHPWEYFHVDFGTMDWAKATGAEHAFYGEVGPGGPGGPPLGPLPDPAGFAPALGCPFDIVERLMASVQPR